MILTCKRVVFDDQNTRKLALIMQSEESGKILYGYIHIYIYPLDTTIQLAVSSGRFISLLPDFSATAGRFSLPPEDFSALTFAWGKLFVEAMDLPAGYLT